MGQVYLSLFVLSVMYKIVHGTTQNNINFLVENREITVGLGTIEEKITIVGILDATEIELKSALLLVKQIHSDYVKLGFLSDVKFKSTYLSAIDSGKENFAKVSNLVQGLYQELNNKVELNPQSDCIVNITSLNLQLLVADSLFISKKFSKIVKTWTAADVVGDKLTILDQFISTYNTISTDWLGKIQTQSTEWNLLKGLEFPDSLKPEVENAICTERSAFEEYTVVTFKGFKNGIVCEILARVPTQIQTYILLQPVNYNGVQISLPELNSLFVKLPNTVDVKSLICDHQNWHNVNNPMCIEGIIPRECTDTLRHNDIYQSIIHCNFGYVEPNNIVHLGTGGLLIQGPSNTVILEGGRSLFAVPPFLIFTPLEISVQLNGKTITVQANTKITEKKLLKTELTELNKQAMLTKAWWSNFLKRLQIEDYIQYSAVIMEFLLAPITLMGLYLGIKNRVHSKKLALKNAKQREEDKKKRNYKESKALLTHLE
jgi:hypothetical protein